MAECKHEDGFVFGPLRVEPSPPSQVWAICRRCGGYTDPANFSNGELNPDAQIVGYVRGV